MEWWPPLFITAADRRRVLRHQFPRPVAYALFAALSADPATLPEWLDATRRYMRGTAQPWPEFTDYSGQPDQLLPSASNPPNRDPTHQLFLFLPGRIAAAGSPDLFPRHGTIPLIRNNSATSQMLLYGLRDDWRIIGWQALRHQLTKPGIAHVASSTAKQLARVRRTLHESLPDWIADARTSQDNIAPAELHKQWLTSPRDDLDGQSPRAALFRFLPHIDRDLEYQQHNWIVTGHPPPEIRTDASAYTAAPFGRFQLSVYHLMTRAMILEAGRLRANLDARRRPARRDQLAQALRRYQQDWQTRPLPEFQNRSGAEIADSERRRIPPTVDARQLTDCDCPVCHSLAHNEPLFWILDFPPLEHDFLFSFCETEIEWRNQMALIQASDEGDDSHAWP